MPKGFSASDFLVLTTEPAMIPTTHESVRLPFRYADPDKEPGRFFALSHAESTCSFVQHDTTVTNARLLAEPLRLDRNGIELV